MYDFGMAMIPGGSQLRPSLFGGMGGFGSRTVMNGPVLGQSEQQWYAEAKSQVAKFDQLVERTRRIANRDAREELVSDYGLDDPTNREKGLYTRNGVESNIVRAESYTPINYVLYSKREITNRVGRLQDYTSDFARDVKYAEDTYGILPEPVVIERIVTVPGAAAPTNWTVPLVIAGGGVILAAALGLFSGGKS